MSVEDYKINALVRQLLSQFWVDQTKVRYGTTGRTVYFHGRFERMRTAGTAGEWEFRGQEVSANLVLLESVEKRLRREPSVLDVVFRLDNFYRDHGKWIPKDTYGE